MKFVRVFVFCFVFAGFLFSGCVSEDLGSSDSGKGNLLNLKNESYGVEKSLKNESLSFEELYAGIDSFFYFENKSGVEDLRDSNYSLFVFNNPSVSKFEISDLKSRGKVVFFELNLAEADVSKPYWVSGWKIGSPEFVYDGVKDDSNKFITVYWDKQWQAIVFNEVIDGILNGYEGVVLSGVDYHKYFRKEGWHMTDSAMAEFVYRISKIAKAQNPEFKVFVENGFEVYSMLNGSVDGVFARDLWFENLSERDIEGVTYRFGKLNEAKNDGMKVLSMDIVEDVADSCNYYLSCKAQGFVCLALDTNLQTFSTDSCISR